MIEIRVDDPADPRIDDYTGLRDPSRRVRVEAKGGFFVAEGVFVIERLLRSDLRIRSVLVTPDRLERLRRLLEPADVAVFVADREVMSTVVGFDIHRGAVAAANRPPPVGLDRAVDSRLVLAVEGVNDHENLGAIIRSAAGLGVDMMVLDPTCADPWYRRSVRVSMGGVFDLPIVRVDSLTDATSRFREWGFRIVAMAADSHAIRLDDVERGLPTVVALGAEGPGLSRSMLETADLVVTIPMHRGLDSLNVGHAAAIAMHHFGVFDQLPIENVTVSSTTTPATPGDAGMSNEAESPSPP